MSIRVRRFVLVVLAAVGLAVPIAIGGSATTALADGICASGHNWDNIRQVCV
jgi:hypothetical protein